MTVVLDNPLAVRRAAMDLLARREHGRVELTRKLRKRGAPEDMIDTALQQLSEEGLLSEARYLESFVAYRARAGYGPLRIREELACQLEVLWHVLRRGSSHRQNQNCAQQRRSTRKTGHGLTFTAFSNDTSCSLS